MAFMEAGRLIAGRYRLDARLDVGGRAQVWRATDLELNRPVAIKILLTLPGSDPSFIEAFRAEAGLEAYMKHPSVVDIHDWGHEGDVNYVVMELLEGQTLRQLIAHGPLAADVVIAMGRQIAAALAYAHAQGIAHGSIGPDHIIIGPDNRATLIDFGLQCRGTCEYPAYPESDTYQLGTLLYLTLTGVSPVGPRPVGIPETEPWPQPVHALNPNVPASLSNVVMKTIAPNPDERYRTAIELQAALDQLAKPKRRAWLWLLLGALIVMIAGAGAWYFVSQQKVTVPDVSGLTQPQAQAKLAKAGLSMIVAGRVASSSAATDTVISEKPAAGSRVRQGSEVSVVLSAGAPKKTVPSVTGIYLEAASSRIASAGLAVGKVTRQNSSTFPTGTVISQAPSAGEQVSPGTAVDLVVSAGVAQVTVPAVTNIAQATAVSTLAETNLVADIETVYSSLSSGTVVSQRPAAGSMAPLGGTVVLSVSKGPTPVNVPDVVGTQADVATTSLQNVGLVPVSVPTSGTVTQVGTVIRQSPGSGEKIAPGSQVLIYVGQ